MLQAAYLLDDADSFARLTNTYNKEFIRKRDVMSKCEDSDLAGKIHGMSRTIARRDLLLT